MRETPNVQDILTAIRRLPRYVSRANILLEMRTAIRVAIKPTNDEVVNNDLHNLPVGSQYDVIGGA